ncbi:MAG: membrane-bound lytic murein transglycosylase MltF, partial [Desulfatitalea sp.]|nr:membrane-bound lytic murein transglycosylase MltF [Desulfatitalea sp.]
MLLIVALVCTVALTACESAFFRNDLEVIKSRGELVLITRNNESCYFEAAHGPAGFEYELAKLFADHLNLRIRTLLVEDEAQMVEALLQGKGDIVAAGAPFGRPAARMVALGPGYLPVNAQVVGRRGGPVVTEPKDLLQTPLWVTGSSAGFDRLKSLKEEYTDLRWQTLSEYSSEEMLQLVWNQSVPLTVVESNTLAMNRRFYPELVVHFTLGETQQLRWAMNPGNKLLQRAVQEWFAQTSTQETVASLVSHYYSHLEDFDYVDLTRYRRRIFDRLPKYQTHFEEAALQNGLDWQLVAAMAYQESHWNPLAVSFTGVRGIMMITEDTAKILGLKDRMAEKEAIYAGTRYLAQLHRLVGEDVPEPDRTLMALAAYNLGFGHLKDARELTAELGKSANSWSAVRETLPLLQKKKYYQNLTHGYARGNEAVQYVDRIRTYHKILNMAMAPEGL